MAENEIEVADPPLPTEEEIIQHFRAATADPAEMLMAEKHVFRDENQQADNPEAIARRRMAPTSRTRVPNDVVVRASKTLGCGLSDMVFGTPVTPDDYSYQVKVRLGAYVHQIYPDPVREVVAKCPMPTLGEFPGVNWEFQRREQEKAAKEGKEAFSAFYVDHVCPFAELALLRERWYTLAKEFSLDIEKTIEASIERWKTYLREVARVNKFRHEMFAKLDAKFEEIKSKALLKIEQEALVQAKQKADEAQRKIDEFLKKRVR